MFHLGFEREKLGEHPVGRVEEIVGEIVTGLDETGLETASHPVDDRPARTSGGGLECEEIDVEDAGHGQHASEVAATTTPVPQPPCGPRFGGT